MQKIENKILRLIEEASERAHKLAIIRSNLSPEKIESLQKKDLDY